MLGEETSSTLLVQVDGTPLSAEVAGRLGSAYVDDSRNVPDLFVLRFLDEGARVLEDAKISIGSKVRLSVQRSGPGGAEPLMTGEVTGVEIEVGSGGTRTIVRGYDHSHRLFRGRRVEAYVKVTASDIAKQVAQRAGLAVGTIDSFSQVRDHVGQGGVSDWAFLRELAADVGAEVAVKDGALDFRRPQQATNGPSGQGGARQDPLVLERGVNLISLRANVTASDQVPAVEVRGWDVAAKKALVATAPAATTSASLPEVQPAGLARDFGAPNWIEPRSGQGTQAQCEASARAIAERLAGSCAELEGVARGNPSLRAGTAVSLSKTGKPFDGRYVLSSTRHEFSKDVGYVTRFTVSNASERSIYGLATGAVTGNDEGRVGGVLTGTVSDIKDPDGRGRVKVTFPVLSDTYVSGWARTLQAGAGKGRGALVLPEVGDEVLVGFGMGDLAEPYVLGGLYNGKDEPTLGWKEHVDSTTGAVKRRAFVSRTGMLLEMIESAQDEKVTLSTHNGKQRVTLVQKPDAALELISEGPVKLIAKQDISVESSSGNITLKGTKISVAATGDLELKGTNVKVTATANGELTGAMVKVAGSTTAEISGSATTTVKGGLVRIN
jgi:phage protein D